MRRTSVNYDNDERFSGRLLYIVTSRSMYDTGRRETIRGYDRFSQTLIPIVRESAKSLSSLCDVDVYLITFYPVNSTRRQELRKALPDHVGLEFWDEASPLFYDYQKGKLMNAGNALSNHTRGLSRQHRFVVKDKLSHYDYFAALEDDMLIHGSQMENFIEVSNELYRLRTTANVTRPRHSPVEFDFYGEMTANQLERTIPGWFRVEAGECTLPTDGYK